MIDSITYEIDGHLVQVCGGSVELFIGGDTSKPGVVLGEIKDWEFIVAVDKRMEERK